MADDDKTKAKAKADDNAEKNRNANVEKTWAEHTYGTDGREYERDENGNFKDVPAGTVLNTEAKPDDKK